ncbi:hypothetical protein [Mesorhizobium sp. ANAO-SY3R2]|uniref:hypothetical protein n=1 Tax=Mesorhizobium sp. ANAO-SY3R2 TaxID=3166644 RepID=UPI00366EFCD0
MTRIGGSRAEGNGDTRNELLQQMHDPAFGKAGHRDKGYGLHSRFGGSDFRDGVTDERENAFLEKMRRIAGDRDADSPAEVSPKEPRLLAMAVNPAMVPFSTAPVVTSCAMTTSLMPDIEAAKRVQALGDRIEQAIRAEMRVDPAAGMTVKLDLPGSESGLAAISVVVSRDNIEVVLRHGGLGDLAGLAQAAQMLAERLQTRFSRRGVQILEVEIPATTEPSRSMDEISALLSRQGERS